jgi:hypothetical protein
MTGTSKRRHEKKTETCPQEDNTKKTPRFTKREVFILGRKRRLFKKQYPLAGTETKK